MVFFKDIIHKKKSTRKNELKIGKKKRKGMEKVAKVGLFQVQNHYYKLLEKHQIKKF